MGAGPAGVLLERGRGQPPPLRDRVRGLRRDVGPARASRRPAALGRVRPRRAARRGGERDPRPLPVVVRLTLYVARDCHLCDLARADLERLRPELGFEVDEVDITGVAELERTYREWIPVIELEGERISVYRVEPAELRARTHPAGR